MTHRRIAFFGLGAMGSRMARHLADAGHTVITHTRSGRGLDGIERADSPRAAAEGADIAISIVTDDDASAALWLDPERGALAALPAGAIAIESSTISVAHADRLAAAAREAGVRLLDAPVLGSRPQADAAALVHLVGGDAGDLERARPVLEAMSRAILHVGPAGAGAAMKLAVNATFAIQVAAFAELLAALESRGIAAGAAMEVLATLPTTSPTLGVVGQMIANRQFDPLFPIDLVHKDLDYACRLGRLPTTETVKSVFAEAARAGHGGDNITGVAQLFDAP